MKAAAKTNTEKPKSNDELLADKIEEVSKKKLQLEESLNTKVHVFLFNGASKGDPVDFVVGFIKEPGFQVKKTAMDMSLRSLTDAGAIILDTSIIKEESDPRIWGEDSEDMYPDIRMGAIMRAQELVSYKLDIIKKK